MRDDRETAQSHPSRITPLRNLNRYRIADGAPDVRGWEVVGGDGSRIGSVNDLLVDTAEGQVRYLDVQLDPGLYRKGGGEEEQIGASTVTEYLVRESISDEENRLTADHHLDSRHHSGERHVVFPVGHAEVDEDSDRVVLPALTAADAVNLPPYVPGEISPDYEQSLRRWFDPSFTPSPERDLYQGEIYDQERFYRRRRAAAQRVR
jgi:PRC-barrel domain